jgi:glycosyltransferase involved in cell wall biosynthesis
MQKRNLAILATHPIQYQAPLFQALASRPELNVQVFFCRKATPREQAGAGFGVEFDWDVPLLDGYPYQFLPNVARRSSVGSFYGLDTPEIGAIVARENYDGVIVNGWHYKSAWQTIKACWRTGTPVLVRSDSHLNTKRHVLKKITKWLVYRRFIPRFDACLAVGKWSAEYFNHYGASPERIFIVPHVVNYPRFRTESTRLRLHRSEFRRQWGLHENSSVALFVGKFIQKKRPLDFVRAVEQAAIECPKIMGLMVGDGPILKKCKDVALQNHLPVRFTGFLNQSQIVQAYVAADILVLPSDGGETWGLVVNEAMASGLPAIVSSQVGCGPDLIEENVTGGTFPVGNVIALADTMKRWANPERCRKALPAIQEKIASCSIQHAVEGVLAAINSFYASGFTQ